MDLCCPFVWYCDEYLKIFFSHSPFGFVLGQVSADGEAIPGASGGGTDRHSFGVGGALCELSNCYQVSIFYRVLVELAPVLTGYFWSQNGDKM